MKSNYSVGLTTLVEALGIGLPIIVSDNPYFEMDVEREGVGVKVPYGDVEAWVKAVNYLSENKELAVKMGLKARKLAEDKYNLELYSKEIVDEFILSMTVKK